jgi:hypothetical protein
VFVPVRRKLVSRQLLVDALPAVQIEDRAERMEDRRASEP